MQGYGNRTKTLEPVPSFSLFAFQICQRYSNRMVESEGRFLSSRFCRVFFFFFFFSFFFKCQTFGVSRSCPTVVCPPPPPHTHTPYPRYALGHQSTCACPLRLNGINSNEVCPSSFHDCNMCKVGKKVQRNKTNFSLISGARLFATVAAKKVVCCAMQTGQRVTSQ